jgi:hypothetical protein
MAPVPVSWSRSNTATSQTGRCETYDHWADEMGRRAAVLREAWAEI